MYKAMQEPGMSEKIEEPADLGAKVKMIKGEFSTLALPRGYADAFLEGIYNCSASPAIHQGFEQAIGKRDDIAQDMKDAIIYRSFQYNF